MKKMLLITGLLLMINVLSIATIQSGSSPTQTVYASQSSSPPNIVVVMADDLDLGLARTLYQNGHLSNIRTYIGDEGAVFRNAYVTTPLCCPSRTTFLTGQYTHNHNVRGNTLPDGGVTMLDDTNTLATWLHDGGYFTGLVGKYLNGYGDNPLETDPTSPENPNYVPPGYDYWRGLINETVMYNYSLNADGTVVEYGNAVQDYQVDVLANLATEFINQTETDDTQPFFLLVTPFSPHIERGTDAPWLPGCDHWQLWSQTIRPAPRHVGTLSYLSLPQPPSFNEADISDKAAEIQLLPLMTSNDIACAEQNYRNMGEATLAIDDLVGSIVASLMDNDEWENTVFIFTSDNGYYHGEHRLFTKVFAYEEGIKVPLVIRAPGYPSGQVIDQYVLNNDLAPTIAAFAGVVPQRAVDGRSLQPLLINAAYAPWRNRFLIELLGTAEHPECPNYSAVRTAASDMATPNQLYLEYLGSGDIEYYNLASDPYQIDSAHNDQSTLLQRQILEQWLNDFRTCGNGTCQTFEDS